MTDAVAPLLCVCGRPAEAPTLKDQPWARYVGYGDHGVVQFCSDFAAASGKTNYPDLLETAPKPGDRCWLRLSHPFVTGQTRFWCVFTSPAMVWNGPEPDGPELSKWALVEGRILQAHPCEDDRGEARIAVEAEVLSVVTLDTLARSQLAPLPASGDTARKLIQNDECLDRLEPAVWQGDFGYIAATEQETDWGQWSIVHRRGGHLDLLATGHWGYHYDHFWAGRVQLTDLPDYLQTHLSVVPHSQLPTTEPSPIEPLETPKQKLFDIRFAWPNGRW